MIERLDAMFAARRLPGRDRRVRRRVDVLRRLAVPQLDRAPAATWTTCATRSSPFVDARYPTAADRDHRGLTGKSSGGYGAMVVPMLRPDVFGALASHAGDALFEACYLPEFPKRRAHAARRVRRLLGRLLRAARRAPTTSTWSASRAARALRLRGRLLARPGAARARRCCPFDLATGRLIDDVWAQWLDEGPGADGAAPRRRAALDAPHLPRRRHARRVLPRPRRARRSRPSSTSSASSTRSSSSTASTAASPTATRARSASSCCAIGRDRRGAVAAHASTAGHGAVARVRVDVALARQQVGRQPAGRASPRPPGSTDRCRSRRAARCRRARPRGDREERARARRGAPARDGGATSSTRSARRARRRRRGAATARTRASGRSRPAARRSRQLASSASQPGCAAAARRRRAGRGSARRASPARAGARPARSANAPGRSPDSRAGSGNRGASCRPLPYPTMARIARHHRPQLPDDVGADQARARAAGARRGAGGPLPRRARRSRTCRARRARPGTT